MTKHTALVALFLAPLACFAQVRRVAIYDFDSAPVRPDATSIYGDAKKVGGIVASRIMSKLLDAQGFQVIDRQEIDNIMKEQNLRFSDRFDPREAPRIGKLLHVDAIVVGSVDALGASMKNNRLGIGRLGVGGAESTAQATVSMRVISTETGQVLIAESIDAKGSHSLGKGATFLGKGGGEQGVDRDAHPEALAATAALEKAADELAGKIIDRAASLPARNGGAQTASIAPAKSSLLPAETDAAPAAPAPKPRPSAISATSPSGSKELKIGRIDGRQIFIIGGTNDGVKVGETFEVRHPTGTMSDGNGGVIQTDEKVDTIVVTDVEDKYSVAHSLAATPLAKVGDRLKPMRPVVHHTRTYSHSSTAVRQQ